MAWFRKEHEPLPAQEQESRVPEGLYVKCNGCKETIYRKEVVANQAVCPRCAFHFRISARERLSLLCDSLWEEFDQNLVSSDPLKFKDTKNYADRLVDSKAKTDSYDALVSAVGTMGGLSTEMAVMEYGFIGGSMGVVVGEKVTRAVERAIREKLPLLVVSCSGGARMMEGTLAMMAKIWRPGPAGSARFHFISLMTSPRPEIPPAMLGDLNVSEPGALIGFAGPRVIEQTIRQKLPEGFQRAEFLLEHGMLDMVVDRRNLKATLVKSFRFLLN
jgi:acetyl-CoA carboxylase carboxyl transferase subunit beta